MNTVIHNAAFYREEIEVLTRVLSRNDLSASAREQFTKQLASARRHLADAITAPQAALTSPPPANAYTRHEHRSA